jgi:hypothetical protein
VIWARAWRGYPRARWRETADNAGVVGYAILILDSMIFGKLQKT